MDHATNGAASVEQGRRVLGSTSICSNQRCSGSQWHGLGCLNGRKASITLPTPSSGTLVPRRPFKARITGRVNLKLGPNPEGMYPSSRLSVIAQRRSVRLVMRSLAAPPPRLSFPSVRRIQGPEAVNLVTTHQRSGFQFRQTRCAARSVWPWPRTRLTDDVAIQ